MQALSAHRGAGPIREGDQSPLGASFPNPILVIPVTRRGRPGGTCLWLQGAGNTSFPYSAFSGALAAPAYWSYADPAAVNAPPTAHLASMLCHERRGRRAAENPESGETGPGPGRNSNRPVSTLGNSTRSLHRDLTTLASWPCGATRLQPIVTVTEVVGSWKDGMRKGV